jgi:hypothetical protein
MKLLLPRNGRSGFMTLVMIVLLSVMVVYIVGNAVALRHLKRELQLVEKRQLHRHAPVAKGAPAP